MQVVFAGFSAESLYQRILDCKPNVILTSSAVKRGAKIIKLKEIVDDALKRASDEGHTVGEYLQGRTQVDIVMEFIIVANIGQHVEEFWVLKL